MNLAYLKKLYFHPSKGVDKSSELNAEMAPIYINSAYKEVFLAHSWIYRKRYGQIILIPRYTTGTVSVTKYNGTNESESRTITFTGASLTADMIGRFVKFQDGDKWYRINYLTGSTAYLYSPVTDVTSGSKTFQIWKRFYNLKSDVAEFLDFGRWENGVLEFNPNLDVKYSDITKESTQPSVFNTSGIDEFIDTTSSGTVVIAKDANLGTVTSINLLSAGYDIGDVASIDDVDYYIKRIESDSRLIFFNYFSEEKNGSNITLRKNNPVTFEFYNPPDDYFPLPYSYYGKAYDLVHETKDTILLPNNFIPAIISRAHYNTYKANSNPEYVNMLNIYNAELEGLKSKVQIVKSSYTKFSPEILGSAPGRG